MYYSELMQFAAREEFRNFVVGMVEEVLRTEYVQAVQVGIDEYWLEWFLFEAFGRRGLPEFQFQPRNVSLQAHTREFRLLERYPPFNNESLLSEFLSPKWNPPFWDSYCRSQGIAENLGPIYIKFLLRQRSEPRRTFETVQWERHPLRFEYRPPIVGVSALAPFVQQKQLAPGSGIISSSTGNVGTAGGFIRDPQSGDLYMVTCSHVVGQPGDEISYPPPGFLSHPKRVGAVVHKSNLTPSGPLVQCSLRQAPNAATIDVGIVQLDQDIRPDTGVPKVGQVNFVAMSRIMAQHQPIALTGSTSGQVHGELGPLTAWAEIAVDGRPHCFGNIFEITPPKPYYLNTSLVKGGDSGAWVVNSTSGLVSWDGAVIGCDGAHAYACFAEDIVKECSTALQFAVALA